MQHFELISSKALEMLTLGTSKNIILSYIASESESFMGNGSAVSILVLDQDGLLRNGASPRLPVDYLAAIDGIKPDPHVGTCAAAAATGEIVFTPDFRADNKWAELRHLPIAIGYTGAWSMPIKTDEGKVLGTFGTYFRDIRKPSHEEIKGVELLANAASRILLSTTK